MPRYKKGSGSLYYQTKLDKQGRRVLRTIWLSYYHNKKRIRESSGTTDRAEARRILQERVGLSASGKLVSRGEGVTFKDLADLVIADYRTNGKRSLSDTQRRFDKHLTPFFSEYRAHEIHTDIVRRYVKERQEAGASNATINRELAALKRGFSLLAQADRLSKKPYIPKLQEDNVRQGFFEREDFDALLAKLPDWLQAPVTFSYLTGWRIRSEVLSLTWSQVNLQEGSVTLYHGTTKNRKGRLIYLPAHMLAILEQQDRNSPYVFTRKGQRISYPYVAWRRAVKEAELDGKIPHDFRRTAVRNMVRAGIPERVAMQIAGHKTRSIFDRYHIVADNDLREAAQKMGEFFGHTFGHTIQNQEEKISVSR